MTDFTYFLNEKNFCETMRSFAITKQDDLLAKFYENAASGFEKKMMEMTLEAACIIR